MNKIPKYIRKIFQFFIYKLKYMITFTQQVIGSAISFGILCAFMYKYKKDKDFKEARKKWVEKNKKLNEEEIKN